MSSGTDGTAITEALVANVLNARFEDIEPEVVNNTKQRILDMIGNGIAGAKCDGNPELAEVAAGWGGKKEATILGYGDKGPIADVAFVNCIFGRSFDRGPLTYVIDGKRSPNHITETSALTAIALGESKGISGKELIAAMVVGDDLAARLHLAIDRAQPGQSLPPGTPPPPPTRGSEEAFAAAAIAGRILALNNDQLRNAFGLATMLSGRGGGGVLEGGPPSGGRPSGASGAGGPPESRPGWQGIRDPSFIAAMERAGREDSEKNVSTKLSNGISARNGIYAVQLGKAGWPGVKDPFFGQNGGHFPGLNSVHHPERITGDLGKKFIVEVCFKPYPGGRPTGAPTAAALAMARKHNIKTDDVEEIILHLSPVATAAHYATPYVIGDYPPMNALWSYYFAVASALYRKSAAAENFTGEMVREPRLQALIKKVKLGYLDKPEGVELEVIMKDGGRFSEYVRTALGDPSDPLPREGLIAKFMEQIEFSRLVEKKDAEKIIELVEGLEKIEDVRAIAGLAKKRANRQRGSRSRRWQWVLSL